MPVIDMPVSLRIDFSKIIFSPRRSSFEKRRMSFADKIFRHVPVVFASVMFVFIAVLTWLGWVLIEQDRDLATQRKRDAIEASVSKVSAMLTTQIADNERILRLNLAEWPQVINSRNSRENPQYHVARVALCSERAAWKRFLIRL